MDATAFLKRYRLFFTQCTPPPSETSVSAIIEKALVELEEIREQLTRENNPANPKSPQQLQKMAEAFLETRLPKMLDVRGPIPKGSQGHYIAKSRGNDTTKKPKKHCKLCRKLFPQRWSGAYICHACEHWDRRFFTTYFS